MVDSQSVSGLEASTDTHGHKITTGNSRGITLMQARIANGWGSTIQKLEKMAARWGMYITWRYINTACTVTSQE